MYLLEKDRIRWVHIEKKKIKQGEMKLKGRNAFLASCSFCLALTAMDCPLKIQASDCVTLQSVFGEDDLYFNPRERGDNGKPSGKVIQGMQEAS